MDLVPLLKGEPFMSTSSATIFTSFEGSGVSTATESNVGEDSQDGELTVNSCYFCCDEFNLTDVRSTTFPQGWHSKLEVDILTPASPVLTSQLCFVCSDQRLFHAFCARIVIQLAVCLGARHLCPGCLLEPMDLPGSSESPDMSFFYACNHSTFCSKLAADIFSRQWPSVLLIAQRSKGPQQKLTSNAPPPMAVPKFQLAAINMETHRPGPPWLWNDLDFEAYRDVKLGIESLTLFGESLHGKMGPEELIIEMGRDFPLCCRKPSRDVIYSSCTKDGEGKVGIGVRIFSKTFGYKEIEDMSAVRMVLFTGKW